MTPDEIADMARAVNLPYRPETGEIQNLGKLVWFARIVAATEREECAKVCDRLSAKVSWEGYYAEDCAAAIRARGEK